MIWGAHPYFGLTPIWSCNFSSSSSREGGLSWKTSEVWKAVSGPREVPREASGSFQAPSARHVFAIACTGDTCWRLGKDGAHHYAADDGDLHFDLDLAGVEAHHNVTNLDLLVEVSWKSVIGWGGSFGLGNFEFPNEFIFIFCSCWKLQYGPMSSVLEGLGWSLDEGLNITYGRSSFSCDSNLMELSWWSSGPCEVKAIACTRDQIFLQWRETAMDIHQGDVLIGGKEWQCQVRMEEDLPANIFFKIEWISKYWLPGWKGLVMLVMWYSDIPEIINLKLLGSKPQLAEIFQGLWSPGGLPGPSPQAMLIC